MKLSLFGCGSIGERHANNLKTLGYDVDHVFDTNFKKRDTLSKTIGAKPINDPEEGLINSDAVFICTPPDSHTDLIQSAILSGAHVFVEKPISNSEAELVGILKLADEKHLKVMVGYMLKFHPTFIKMKELIDSGRIGRILSVQSQFGYLLSKWRPETNYDKSYFARYESGGGILLDASHELDYIRWIFGDPTSVYCKISHLSDLDIETEDQAIIILESASGQIIEVHLDCIDYNYNRSCNVIGTKGTLNCNFEGELIITDDEGIHEMGEPFELNDVYKREIKYFMDSIKTGSKIVNDGWSGLGTLKLVSEAKSSALSRKTNYI